MVAIVSGNTLGLNLSSLASLGAQGQFGNAGLGQANGRAYVNAATGNLVLQDLDSSLVGLGGTETTLRTYNSQGQADGDNNDGWRNTPYKTVVLQTNGTLLRTDSDGSTNTFTWNAAANAFLAATGAGQATDRIVADAGHYVFTDGTTGRTETYEGSGAGRILSSADTNANTFTYSYDAAGLVHSVTNADGETVTYTYNANRELTQVTTTLQGGAVLSDLSYTYDSAHRLSQVSVLLNQSGDVPAGAESATAYTTTYTYVGTSTRVAGIVQDDGTRLSFDYVSTGGVFKVSSITDGAGQVTRLAYNTTTRTTTVTDALGVASTYRYDALGQLVEMRIGVTAGNTSGLSSLSYSYDTRGNVVSIADALGRAVTYAYDGQGNQVAQVDPLGNKLQRTFNARNQLLTETVFPQENTPSTTRYVYDADNSYLLRFGISAEGRVAEYRYNASGLRTSVIQYAGGLYNLTGLNPADVPTEAQLQTWAAAQDLTQTERADMAYDHRGQLQSSSSYSQVIASGEGVAASASVTHFVYDTKGQLLQTVSPQGDGISQTVYDGLGRVISTSTRTSDGSLNVTALSQYDDAHARTTVTLANGLDTVSAYDQAGRVVSIVQSGGPADATLGTTRITYDAVGHVAMSEDPTGQRQWMLYDAAGRKVADIGPDGQLTEYVWDVDNKLTHTIAYAAKVNVDTLVDGSGQPLTAWNANPSSAPAGTVPVTLGALRQPSSADQHAWNFYDADQRLVFQVDALGHVTQTQYDGASRVVAVTRLATPVDTTQLASGLSLGGLLGGLATTVSLSTAVQGTGPNAPVILTAHVDSTNDASGSVTFYSGNQLLGSAAVVNHVATFAATNLPAGSNAFSAVYSGDANNLGATSNLSNQVIQPAPATTTALTANATAAQASNSITLTATVTGQAGSPAATGTVIFYSGTRAVGIASVLNGVAKLNTNSLPLGSNVLTAVYQGDEFNAKSSSTAVTQVVSRSATTTAETVTTLLASNGRSNSGEPITLTAQVSGANPGGTVNFYNRSTLIGSATLSNGLAVLTVSDLPAGIDALSARYLGDTQNNASVSAAINTTVLTPPSVSLTSSVTNLSLGEPVTLTAFVSGTNAGGVVSFFNGSRLLGSAAVAGGVANLTVLDLPAGADSVTAVYSGDAANAAGTSTAVDITVAASATSTTLTSVEPSTALGEGFVLIARVEGAGTPGGSVTFYQVGTVLGSATVVNGQASFTVTALPQGANSLQAVYEGDAGHTGSSSTALSHTVLPADATHTALTVSTASSVYGSPVTLTAKVGGAGTLGGTVTFFNGNAELGTSPVSNGVASLTLNNLPVGADALSAHYSGDASHAASVSAAVNETVAAASTTLALASSSATSAFGAAVTLTATLPNGGAGTTGLVTFFNGRTALGTATVANGVASLTLSTLPVGKLALGASYAGDAQHATSVATFTQTVVPATTTATLSVTPASAKQGGAVVLTSRVASDTGSRAGGSVTFYRGAEALGKANVVNGFAALTLTNLPVGGSEITAVYAGDAQHATSTSAASTVNIATAPLPTSITVQSSDPTVQQNHNFTLVAKVIGTNPGGWVTFVNGQTVLGTASVGPDGTASLTTTIRTVSTASIAATYAGDAANATSASSRVTVRVTAGSPTAAPPVLPATTTTLTASAASAVRGDPVTLSASVRSSVSGAVPSGTVSFFNGTTLLGSATLTNGQANVTFTNLPVGADQIRAVYSGDAQASSSQSAVVAANISLASSTVALFQSATSAAAGSAVVLTAQVSGNAVPGGTVTFYAGSTALATVSVANGLASRSVTNLPVGAASISARYNGDTNNAAATSAAGSVTITAAPAASGVTLDSLPGDTAVGEPALLTAHVSGSTPGGTVSFFNGNTLLGSVDVRAGLAQLAITSLPRGNASLRAVYSGDAGNTAATSGVVADNVQAAATTTELATSAATIGYGSALTLTATVKGTGSPAGSVRFYNGSTVLGTVALSNGQASLTLRNLPIGSDSLRAVYLGNGSNTTSTSDTVIEAVTAASTSLGVTSAPSIAQNRPLSVQISGATTSPAATGNVTFLNGQTVVGVAPLVNGVATLSAGTTLAPGSYQLTASYGGDARNAAAQVSFSQTIEAAPTTVSLTSSLPYVGQNMPLVLTAKVSGSDATGTVTFYSGNTALGTATLVNGLAAITVDTLASGVNALSVAYSGDANNLASTSAVLQEQVVAAPVNISASASVASVKQGAPLTLTAKVSGNNPSGSVTFVSGKTTLGVATIVNGVATLVVPSLNLPTGAQQIIAVYLGDASNPETLSQPVKLTVTAGTIGVPVGRSANDRTVTEVHDREGRIVALIDSEGYLTEMRYNAAGHLSESVRYAHAVQGFTDAASIAARVDQARKADSLVGLRPETDAADIHAYLYYNAKGQKIGEVDGERYLTEFIYDTNGNLTRQIRYANAVTAALPGANLGAVRPVASASDQVQSTTWDALGRLSTQTNAEGTITGYTYDEVSRVVATKVAMNTDELRTLTVRYDLQGRVVAELSPEGAALLTGGQTQTEVDAIWAQYATHHTYDAAGRRTSSTDANGLRSVFLYDDAGRLRYTVNAAGEVQERRYGALGRLAQTIAYAQRLNAADVATLQGGVLNSSPETDQAAAVLQGLQGTDHQSVNSFFYDKAGELIETTDAEAGDTLLSYNAFGEVSRTTTATGTGPSAGTRTVDNTYDRRGLNTRTVQDAAGLNVVTRAEYDAFGRVTAAVDGNGNRLEQSYDRLGRVVATVDPTHATRSTAYDAFDRTLTQTDALGHATHYAYDDAARSMTVTTPEGVTLTSVHNRHGQTHSVTDANGNVATYHYDANGNLDQTDTPLTHTSSQYDHAGRLTRTVDANGVAVAYAYDSANRVLTRTLDPEGLALSNHYTYDAKGQQATATDANGVVTETRYDLNGRVLTQTVDPAGLALTTTYAYDRSGEVLSVTSPGGSVTSYVYDKLGRRIEEHQDPAGLNLVSRYAYDAGGNLVAKTDPSGHVTRYFYDADHRLSLTVDAVGSAVENRYDAEGRLVGTIAYAKPVLLPEGAVSLAAARALLAASASDVKQDRVLDDDGRLSYLVDGTGGVTQYTYDGNGNVVRSTTYATPINRAAWAPGTAPSVATSTGDRVLMMSYDALNRVTWTCDGAGSVTHSVYDANGNVVRHEAFATKLNAATWNPSSPNAITDSAHDMVTRTVYDAANRAVFMVDATGALVAQTYDANGNVVDRVAYAGKLPADTVIDAASLTAAAQALAQPAHDAHIRRLYDAADRLVYSVDGLGAVTQQVYDRNGNVVKQVQYAQPIGAGDRPDSVQPAYGSDHVSLMGYDAVNRKTVQIDALGGVVRYVYDAAGNLTVRRAYANALANPPVSYTDPTTVTALAASVGPDAGDRILRIGYDAANRQVIAVDAEGGVTETVYDGVGHAVADIARSTPASIVELADTNVMAETLAPYAYANDAHDRVTVRAFDGAGRQTYGVDAQGHVSSTVYNGVGQVTSTTLHAKSLTNGAAPALETAGNAAAIGAVATDPQDRTDRFSYDGAGNLISSTDALGFTESHVYDGLGNKLQFTNKLGAIWTYDYDQAGHLLTETTPAVALGEDGVSHAIVTKMAYDALGNLTARTEALGLPEQRTTQYVYDALGRQVKTIFPEVKVYDASQDDLAVNGANGLATRTETLQTLSSEVSYDVFGNAVANRDVAGNYSYKSYDALGRVGHEVDALGYVTAYQRNIFGDATSVTRSSQAIVLPAGAGPSQVSSAVLGVNGFSARTVNMQYDRLGRSVLVTEPEVWVHNQPNSGGYYYAKRTYNQFNAFGEVEHTGVYVNSEQSSETRNFYDRRGQLVGTLDPLGYLTTQQYDAAGNLAKRTEYANSFLYWNEGMLPLGLDGAGAASDNDSIDDRTKVYAYDLLNRQTRQTQVNVEHSNASNGSVVNDHAAGGRASPGSADLVTQYQYDAVGNLLNTIDALGGQTTSQYDALGRVTRVLMPERTVVGDAGHDAQVRPEIDFQHDAYGNVVVQRQRGNGEAHPDRVTRTEFDSHGHAVKSTDAAGYEHFMSYDARGALVKQWQGVTGVDDDGNPANDTHTLYTFFEYDALGRQTAIITPGTNSVVANGTITAIDQAAAGVVQTRSVYNAYGEVVQRGTYKGNAPVFNEYFDYDAAGRLWRTNSGDGVAKVMLFDELGHQTVQMSSAGGATGSDLTYVTDAETADGLSQGVRKSEALVDALGRVVEQHLPPRADEFTGAQFWPVIHQSFDRWGNVVTQSDPRNSTWLTTYRYNANNQVVEQRQPNPAASGYGGGVYGGPYGGGVYGGGVYGGGVYGGGAYGGAYGGSIYGGPITRIRYDALGRQVAMIDANGHINSQEWNSGDSLVRELHADGGVVQDRYNVFGEREQQIDAEGRTTDYRYDILGRTTRIVMDAPVGTVDSDFKVTEAAGQVFQEFTYDSAGRRLTETNAAGETKTYTYDLRGNVIATRQPMGQVDRAAFDEFGKQIAALDANGVLSSWKYDSFGRLQEHVDLGGHQYWFEYDNAKQLIHQYGSTEGALQNINYGYDAAGQLVYIDDVAASRLTRYGLDAAGKHVHERTTQNGTVYQDNYLAYDALGRLSQINALDDFQITFDYDAVGNKTHQRTYGHALARAEAHTVDVQVGVDESGAPVYAQETTYTTVYDGTSQDLWSAYDAMNRQILVDGLHSSTDLTTNNINGAQGHLLTYDLNGNRVSDTHWGQQVTRQEMTSYDESGNPMVSSSYVNREGAITEYYTYDNANRLSTVATGGFDVDLNPLEQSKAIVLDRRIYDAAGRLIRMGPAGTLPNDYIAALNEGGKPDANGSITRTNRYDHNGRLQAQHVQKPDGSFSSDIIYEGTVNSQITEQTGVDESGEPVFTTRTVTQTGPGYDNVGNILGYRVTDSTGVTSNYNMTLTRFDSYKEASVSGFRSDNVGSVRTTTSHYDVNGQLVSITDDTGSSVAHRQFVNDANGMVLLKTQQGNGFKQLVVNGEVYATYGVAEDPQRPGTFTTQTTFDTNFQPISTGYPSAGVGAYTVRAGDTLETIAQASYGDSQLWYLIADANGLTGNSDLRVGQTLNIPTKVGSIHNTAGTFKPYNASEVRGDTAPTLPVPQSDSGGGCGVIGQIIVIIVAVVVSFFVGPEVLALIGPALGGATTLAATVVAGAITGAISSVASQLVGMAIGVTDQFSWKSVGLAAIGGAVGGGLQGVAGGSGPLSGPGFQATVARAVIGNALTQGVAVATGLQDHFSWKGVAASAVGAGVSFGVGNLLSGRSLETGEAVRPAAFSDLGRAGEVIRGTLTGFASGMTTAAVRGGHVSLGRIATDAFGNALGSSVADALKPQAYDGPDSAEGIARANAERAQAAANRAQAAVSVPQPTNTNSSAQDEDLEPVNDRNGSDVESDNYKGGRKTVTVRNGQGVLSALKRAGVDNIYAAYGQLARSGQLSFDAKGMPVVQPGQELYLDDANAAVVDEKLGRALTGREGTNRTIIAEAQARARAEAAAQAQAAQNTSATPDQTVYGNEGRNYPPGTFDANYGNEGRNHPFNEFRGPSGKDLVGGSDFMRGYWNRTLERVEQEGYGDPLPVLTAGRRSATESMGALAADWTDDWHSDIKAGITSPTFRSIRLGGNPRAPSINSESTEATDAMHPGTSVAPVVPTSSGNAVVATREIGINASLPSLGAIEAGYGSLSRRQASLLEGLSESGTSLTIHRSEASIRDLGALTAATGDEFGMFRRGSQSLLVRGNGDGLQLTEGQLRTLADEGYRLSGHSHPRVNGAGDLLSIGSSEGDRDAIGVIFKQERSVIIDSGGNRNVFTPRSGEDTLITPRR